MSGAKSGGIGIAPIIFLAGAPIVLAVAGTVFVAGAAVNAYVSAREKIRREREEAMGAQRTTINNLADIWKAHLAAAERPVTAPSIRTVEESVAAMAAAGPVTITGSAAEELIRFIPEHVNETPISPDDTWREDERKRCLDVLNCMENLMQAVTEPLPDTFASRINELHKLSDAGELTACALQLRMEITLEAKRIREKREADKLRATAMLAELPEGTPGEARNCFEEAAQGISPITDELIRLFDNLKESEKENERQNKQAWQKHREAAAQVLANTLKEMGYDVGGVSSGLFTTGGEAYFRNDSWDDGYCVQARVSDNRIHFKAVRDCDSDPEHDKSMERAWKNEFENVTERLNKAGLTVKLDFVHELVAGEKVPKKGKIPLNTRKKSASATGDQQQKSDAQQQEQQYAYMRRTP